MALSAMASKTGCTSVWAWLITRRISAVAVCCSKAAVRSRFRASSSLNTLEEFDFSSMKGRWKITLVLTSSNGGHLTATEDYDYGGHFIGDVACQQTAHALTPAVQDLVRNAVQHPDFPGLLTDPRRPGR
jgi:hypothetical protein